MIQWSGKALLKLLGVQFKSITNRSWLVTWFQWIINEKERLRKWLHKHTEDQLIEYRNNKESKTYKLAMKFKKKSYTFATMVSKIEEYVKRNYTYVGEKIEKWQTAEETIIRKKGDCDDLNNLIYILCMLCGVPNWLLWNVIGDTKNGYYHFYCLFFYTKRRCLIPIDATYEVELGSMDKQKEFKIGKTYMMPDFIWNEQYIFKTR